jgi:Mce-associated membrane protein
MKEADMTDSTDSNAGDADASDESPPKAATDRAETEDTDTAATDGADSVDTSRSGPRRPWVWVAAALVAVLVGGGVFGFIKYQQATSQLEQLRQSVADREAAAQLAKDYALKSLNYTYEDPDAFFRAVEDGVSQQLKDKYVNASELLTAVMLEAQVTSSGEVLATDPVLQPDGSYRVVVSAHQTTRNLQNPTPKVSIILLRVTVNKVGDGWQVADIGPETGSKPPVDEQLPALPPPAPPTPTKPTPQR